MQSTPFIVPHSGPGGTIRWRGLWIEVVPLSLHPIVGWMESLVLVHLLNSHIWLPVPHPGTLLQLADQMMLRGWCLTNITSQGGRTSLRSQRPGQMQGS